MDEAVEAVEVRSQADAASVVSVHSSAPSEGVLSDLWRRVRRFRGRSPVEPLEDAAEGGSPTRNLQDVINTVSGQAQDDPVPSEAPSSSPPDVERCGVCERSFNHRGPTVKCSGCAKRVHKNFA